ncbi:(S)-UREIDOGLYCINE AMINOHYDROLASE [Salix koriyanagi]|uniref:(S)-UREIDOGLYCINE AMINOHYDROLASE n=1 Tax=Salix koriyanagi TaxID=2511006 RepID=A0A9Q0Q7X1_9ROSI|nr:(S)-UREIDOGLYCINE AMINOHYDROLASE [Salix koriyanagi]
MQTPTQPSVFLPLPLLSLSSITAAPSDDGGFCSAPSDDGGFCSAPSLFETETASSKPLYWRVTNPTLSPAHLQDLPGFTRSVYKRDHALITPESHVFSPLPEWTNTMGAYLITPAMGSHFVMYLAKMQDVWFRKTQVLPDCTPCNHANDKNHVTEQIVGSTDQQPLLETPGEVFELRKLPPQSLLYDFNIHIMDFQPGEFLNVKFLPNLRSSQMLKYKRNLFKGQNLESTLFIFMMQ